MAVVGAGAVQDNGRRDGSRGEDVRQGLACIQVALVVGRVTAHQGDGAGARSKGIRRVDMHQLPFDDETPLRSTATPTTSVKSDEVRQMCHGFRRMGRIKIDGEQWTKRSNTKNGDSVTRKRDSKKGGGESKPEGRYYSERANAASEARAGSPMGQKPGHVPG